MLKIVTVPNPILRQVSKPILKVDQKLLAFIDDLGHTLKTQSDPPGVGISAIQVGMPLQIIQTLLPEGQSNDRPKKDQPLKLTTYLNPTIIKHSQKVTLAGKPDHPFLEGCLSVPHIYGPVWRYEWIRLSYQTLNQDNSLTGQTAKFSGFIARVMQHELDHLQGILFTDYVLGRSPQKTFNPLGKVTDIYFDQDGDHIPIQNPEAILTW